MEKCFLKLRSRQKFNKIRRSLKLKSLAAKHQSRSSYSLAALWGCSFLDWLDPI